MWQPGWEGSWGRMATCVCMAGSLPCSPGTTIALFVNWPYPGLPHCRWILHQLSHQGSPGILEWVAYPFSRGSSQPQESNWGLLHCRQILYQLNYQGSPQYKIKSKKKSGGGNTCQRRVMYRYCIQQWWSMLLRDMPIIWVLCHQGDNGVILWYYDLKIKRVLNTLMLGSEDAAGLGAKSEIVLAFSPHSQDRKSVV